MWKNAESDAGTPWGWAAVGQKLRGGIMVKGLQPKGGHGAVLEVREGRKQEAPVGMPVNLSPFLGATMAHIMMDLFLHLFSSLLFFPLLSKSKGSTSTCSGALH